MSLVEEGSKKIRKKHKNIFGHIITLPVGIKRIIVIEPLESEDGHEEEILSHKGIGKCTLVVIVTRILRLFRQEGER